MEASTPTLCSGMAPEIVAPLEACSIRKTYKKGESLYLMGDEPAGIYCLEKGLVGLVTVSTSGRERLVRLFKAGQYFGHRSLFAGESYHANAVALDPVECRVFPKKDVMELCRKFPEFAVGIAQKLARELGRAEHWLGFMTDRQVSERVADGLLYLKAAHPEHNWTRREIADFCGTTTESVIRTLAAFEAEGLIRQKGRHIDILQREALLECASPQ
ncbi:MAG: Crp/Fnr family transcriptional regulator [Bdellovibrionaceae bacterium]|nr:Crp/Fnr family transcriptional regulator [Pseudobdellovibrionaceae bacterium]